MLLWQSEINSDLTKTLCSLSLYMIILCMNFDLGLVVVCLGTGLLTLMCVVFYCVFVASHRCLDPD